MNYNKNVKKISFFLNIILPLLCILIIFFGLLLIIQPEGFLLYLIVFIFFYIFKEGETIWSFILFSRFLKKNKNNIITDLNDDCINFSIDNELINIPWNSVKRVYFSNMTGGILLILFKSWEKYFGYFSIETMDNRNIIISPFYQDLEKIIQEIIKKANLKKITPTMEKSIKSSFFIWQRGSGSFNEWIRVQEDYILNSDDLNIRACHFYFKDSIKLFFIFIIAVLLIFIFFYFLY